MQRRLALDGVMLQHLDADAQTLDGRDASRKLSTATVEERDRVTGAHAQHAHCMVRRVLGQHASAAGAQRSGHVEARGAGSRILHGRIFA